MKVLVTCEHLDNKIPDGFQHVFEGNETVLETHRGYDIGAKNLFEALAPVADASFSYPWTRLLIEPNRSLHHRDLYSKFSKKLSANGREKLVKIFYLPYRNEVEDWIRAQKHEQVLHVSVHSFTPVLDGEKRKADIGLLYDPQRKGERAFALTWARELAGTRQYKVRKNYPYLGKADGFTTYLRKQFKENYAGIELEVNQQIAGEPACTEWIREAFKRSIASWFLACPVKTFKDGRERT